MENFVCNDWVSIKNSLSNKVKKVLQAEYFEIPSSVIDLKGLDNVYDLGIIL